MAKKNPKVDGVSIDVAHFSGYKESEFIAEILPGLPARFGDDAKKKVWAKTAFDTIIKASPVPTEKVGK